MYPVGNIIYNVPIGDPLLKKHGKIPFKIP